MSTLEALQYLWNVKWGIKVILWPALFVAALLVPAYMSHEQQKRMRFLKGIAAISLFLLACPSVFAAFSDLPFWNALLHTGGRRQSAVIWGLVMPCVSGIFALAELAARERSRRIGTSPDILVEMEILSTEEGAHLGVTPPDSYSVILAIDGEEWPSRLDLSDCGPIVPGATVVAPVKFLLPEARARFPVGRTFTVWEIGDIGRGRVLKNYHASPESYGQSSYRHSPGR